MSLQPTIDQENPYPLLDLTTALALSACNKAKAMRGDMTLLIVERHLLVQQRLARLADGGLYPTDEEERSDYRYTVHIIKQIDSDDPFYAGLFYKALDDDRLEELLSSDDVYCHPIRVIGSRFNLSPGELWRQVFATKKKLADHGQLLFCAYK